MVCLLYGLFGFVHLYICVFRSVLRIVLHIHKFIFPAFRFLFTRPIPLAFLNAVKTILVFGLWTSSENCEKGSKSCVTVLRSN
jgi:hypothetical protein